MGTRRQSEPPNLERRLVMPLRLLILTERGETRPDVSVGDREIEVLGLVANGHTSKEIGELLFISENTVKNHVRNILDKLGLHSRSEAVLYAVREDIIAL